jgi:hypothetical protein
VRLALADLSVSIARDEILFYAAEYFYNIFCSSLYCFFAYFSLLLLKMALPYS